MDEKHKAEWLDYFEMLLELEKVKFKRSAKPKNCNDKISPDLAIFSDGNPESFGAVAYAVWTLNDGSKIATFLMAKAKLGPLLQKGETVKKELNEATYQSILKTFIFNKSVKFLLKKENLSSLPSNFKIFLFLPPSLVKN